MTDLNKLAEKIKRATDLPKTYQEIHRLALREKGLRAHAAKGGR